MSDIDLSNSKLRVTGRGAKNGCSVWQADASRLIPSHLQHTSATSAVRVRELPFTTIPHRHTSQARTSNPDKGGR